MNDIVLYSKQKYAMARIAQGVNLFITGPGGVGKSVLIREIRNLYGDSTVFMSPTGVAALNIQGSTIHRQFKFGIGFMDSSRCSIVDQSVIDLFRDKESVKRIVIDEISMVRSDLLSAIDKNLQIARRSRKPFGGIQVIVVGDFFQLPPVLQEGSDEAQVFYREYSSPFCFTTESWQSAGFEMIALDKVMRTDDEDFISLLQSIRMRTGIFRDAIDVLNHICYDKYENCDEDSIVLCSTNKDADSINAMNYADLEGEEHSYTAEISDRIKIEPAPKYLDLKYGARIMMLANHMSDLYMNGHLGYVVGFEGDKILVVLDGEKTPIPVEKATWEEQEYCLDPEGKLSTKVVGKFTQYPMKLAYAITIHKSQGVSLSSAHINLGRGAFAHGQAYVGLSRLRSMYRMNLMTKLTASDIIVDPAVVKFYEDQLTANLTSFMTEEN